jgi:hypothetical protein
VKKWLRRVGILLLICTSIGIGYFFVRSHQTIVDMQRVCVNVDSILCDEQFSIRFINDSVWKETYESGLTVSGRVTLLYEKPISWSFIVWESGDDWLTVNEYVSMNPILSRGQSKAFGNVRSSLENQDGKWILSVDLVDRKESVRLFETSSYPWW